MTVTPPVENGVLMPRPRRGRSVLSYLAHEDYTVGDIWPTAATLASHRMDLAAYRRMYEAQDRRCAICDVRKDPLGLVIDHNHTTRKVRGLLCSACNTGIGLLKDSPDVLEVALQYLEERGCYGPNALAEDPL